MPILKLSKHLPNRCCQFAALQLNSCLYDTRSLTAIPTIVFVCASRLRAANIAGWCNGNTTDFGSVIHGSSPCPVVFNSQIRNSRVFLARVHRCLIAVGNVLRERYDKSQQFKELIYNPEFSVVLLSPGFGTGDHHPLSVSRGYQITG